MTENIKYINSPSVDTNKAHKLSSLTIFFPCYNDGGTIGSMVTLAHETASKLTDDFEIIVIDDGSADSSKEVLNSLLDVYPNFRAIFHQKNQGYGGALTEGFKQAGKEFVFYTDGDAQYDVRELTKLAERMNNGVDVVNGFKVVRSDPWYRILIGKTYQNLMKWVFSLKIKDVDCDFRLMRRKIFNNIELTQKSGAICVEMIRKIQDAGFKFTEVGVRHHFRSYGTSQVFNIRRILRALKDLTVLWWRLVGSKFLVQRKKSGRIRI